MSEKEKNAILNEHEMSEEEMQALAGGVHIDWPANCVSTVEDGSSCTRSDACYTLNLQYWRDKSKYGCSATVESTFSTCNSNDFCTFNQIKYDYCSGSVRARR